MADLPFVSCLMPTCGRCPELQHLVEESLESFRIQDYPPERRELLIWNDAPGQHLVCDAPGVRIINASERAPSLGDKYNLMLHEARGEYVCPFEDDDISLPHRISASMRLLCLRESWMGGTLYDYGNPRSYFFLNGTHFAHERGTGYAHNASIFRKDVALNLGGYPSGCKQDAALDGLLRRNCRVAPNEPLSAEECWYIYRWNVGPHLSGNPDVEAAWKAYGERQFQPGVYRLIPRFLRDYPAMVRDLLARAPSP